MLVPSLVVQWLRIHLAMQGTPVWSLVREDPTWLRATKPMHHNCWAHTLQLLKPACPTACALQQETPPQWAACTLQLEKARMQQQRPSAAITYNLRCSMSCVFQFSSVQLLSRVWLSATHEPQHSRPPCPSPTPGVHPDPCPSSRWCHPTISSSVIPFSCLQSSPALGSSHQVAKVLGLQLQH